MEQIGPYRIEKTLGEGSYGQVKLARNVMSGQEVAIKMIEKEKIKTQQQMERLKREVRMLKLLSHPHIVQLYDVVEADRLIYLTMEVANGGEVFDYIVAHGRLREREARRLFRQILSAIAYCHSNFIVHRDIKPENLLLDSQRNVKIIDFGLCNFYQPENFLKTFCGSAYYAAPEMVTGTAYIGPEVDIWSLGIVLYVLLCGALPFHDDNQPRLFEKILQGSFQCPDDISFEGRDLLNRMIVVDPAQRMTIAQVLTHSWVVAETGEVPLYLPQRPHLLEPDERFLQQLPAYGCNIEKVKEDLQGGRFNPETSVYHLLVQKALIEQERQAREQRERESQQAEPTALSARRALLASKTRKSQHQLPPAFDQPTPQPQLPEGYNPRQTMSDRHQAQYDRLRNRRTLAGDPAAADMHAAKARFFSTTNLNELDMQALSQRLAPVSAIHLVPLQTDQQNSEAIERSPSTDQDRNRRFRSLDPAHMEALAKRAAMQFGAQALQPSHVPAPNEPPTGLRVVNGLFNVATSSSRQPSEIEEEIKRVLMANNISFTLDKSIFHCHWQQEDKAVGFTIEICKIATLPLYGLHLNRLLGEPWVYKALCSELTSQMKL